MVQRLGFLIGVFAFVVLVPPSSGQNRQDPPFKLPDNVEQKNDIVYGKGGGRDLKLDLFVPKDGDAPRPAIVFIHGGGWQGGSRGAFRRQAAYLASKGYVGACIEYRLSGEAIFPAAIEDCKCAVRWLRANAATYRIDRDRIASCGGSAGGHLASLVGTAANAKDLEGKGGHADQSSAVQLVVAFNGVFDFTHVVRDSKAASGPVSKFLGGSPDEKKEVYAKASPIVHVSKASPPHLFLHGTADQTVPIQQSREMRKKLQEVGVVAEIYEADGAGHGFFNRPPHFDPTLKRMEEFLNKNLMKK